MDGLVHRAVLVLTFFNSLVYLLFSGWRFRLVSHICTLGNVSVGSLLVELTVAVRAGYETTVTLARNLVSKRANLILNRHIVVHVRSALELLDLLS